MYMETVGCSAGQKPGLLVNFCAFFCGKPLLQFTRGNLPFVPSGPLSRALIPPVLPSYAVKGSLRRFAPLTALGGLAPLRLREWLRGEQKTPGHVFNGKERG